METRNYLSKIRGIPPDVEDTRMIEFIISSEQKDRHGTVLSASGWLLDNYNKNPVVGYQHDVYGNNGREPNPNTIIGYAKNIHREGPFLIAEVVFEPKEINPLAETIFRKVLFGSLRATSVGFLPVEKGHWGKGDEAQGKENETYYFGRRELLEFSIVNIPSNAESLIRGKTSKKTIPDWVRMKMDLDIAGLSASPFF
ncbi:MAG: HK97 family phage prohead protease [Bacteroidales bacterium]|nr:HK97 family phage prohead protease [Bacteroidales bacterium]